MSQRYSNILRIWQEHTCDAFSLLLPQIFWQLIYFYRVWQNTYRGMVSAFSWSGEWYYFTCLDFYSKSLSVFLLITIWLPATPQMLQLQRQRYYPWSKKNEQWMIKKTSIGVLVITGVVGALHLWNWNLVYLRNMPKYANICVFAKYTRMGTRLKINILHLSCNRSH